MKNRKWLVVLALLLCCAVAAAVVPATVAYIADNSNTVSNTFQVKYLPPKDITVPVRVHKNVLCMGEESISPAGFSFRLVNLDTGAVKYFASFTDGWATLDLTFTADDVGKTYNYQLYEVNAGRENVVYDETIYNFSVELQLNEQHEMTAVIMKDGTPAADFTAEFVNLYEAVEIPDTGDHEQMALWMAMLLFSGAGLCVLRRKECTNGRH